MKINFSEAITAPSFLVHTLPRDCDYCDARVSINNYMYLYKEKEEWLRPHEWVCERCAAFLGLLGESEQALAILGGLGGD